MKFFSWGNVHGIVNYFDVFMQVYIVYVGILDDHYQRAKLVIFTSPSSLSSGLCILSRAPGTRGPQLPVLHFPSTVSTLNVWGPVLSLMPIIHDIIIIL